MLRKGEVDHPQLRLPQDRPADLTILEEATEFLTRVQKGENLPLITSCSPGWISFMERFYPEMKNHLLVCVTELNTREQVEAYAGVLGS